MDYAYDGRGNRSQMTVTGADRYTVQYTYDANNRLTQEEKTRGVQTGLTTYSYDPNGNLTQRMELGCDGSPSAASFTYDVFGQQATATYNGMATAYTYNAQGIRVAKTTAGNRTDFLLDGGNVAAEQTDGDITTYLRGVNLIARSDGETTEYYLYNAHGDVVQRTDSTGAVTKTYSYDAFGVEQDPDSTDPNPFRYCGEYFDKETGTYYLRARYYSPGTGRFTQEDPLRNGLNLYVYCINCPLMYSDPSGLVEVPLRDYASTYPGAIVEWDDKSKTATVTYNGVSLEVKSTSLNNRNGRIYVDDSIFVNAFGVGNERLVIYECGVNVSIRANLYIYGDGAHLLIDKETTYEEAVLRAIEEYWNGSYSALNGEYRVSTYIGSSGDGIPVNIIAAYGRASTKYKGGSTDSWNSGNGAIVTLYLGQREEKPYNLKRFKWTSAHEFGHILGVKDAYKLDEWIDVNSIYNKVYMPVTANDIRLVLLAWKSGKMQNYSWRYLL